MIQSIPAFGTLASLQTNRLLFSRLTFFNVGLFGEMLAMAAPLLLGAIAARRQLVLAAWCGRADDRLVVSAAALFLTSQERIYRDRRRAVVTSSCCSPPPGAGALGRARFRGVSAFVVSVAALVLQLLDARDCLQPTVMIKMVGRADTTRGTRRCSPGALAGGVFSGDRTAVEMAVQPSASE